MSERRDQIARLRADHLTSVEKSRQSMSFCFRLAVLMITYGMTQREATLLLAHKNYRNGGKGWLLPKNTMMG